MPRRIAAALAIAAAVLLPRTASAQVIDSIFARYTGPGSPGCAVGVAKDGAIVLERAYGMADIERGVPARPGSIYEAGSVSKQFTAAAILLLARDGKLSLSDDIRKYLPEMPDYGAPVTIAHLLHHISGLRDWGSVSAMEGWPRNSRTVNNDDVLAIASRQRRLNFAPGAHYGYSNTNFNLAAIIVARVSGQSLAAFTRERIFVPLAMTHTGWRERYQQLVPGRAIAYSREGSGYVIDQPIEDAHGNGGLLTTVRDLLAWNAALDADRFGPGFRAAMERTGVLTGGTPIGYAMGLRLADFRGVTEIAHWGSTGGYRAWLARYPSQRLSVALLCNASDAEPVQTGRRVAAGYLSGLAPLERAAPAGNPPPGYYIDAESGRPLLIVGEPDGRSSANGMPLVAVSANRWTAIGADTGAEIDFVLDRDGGLAVQTIGETSRYRRAAPAGPIDYPSYLGRYCAVDNPFCLSVTLTGTGGLAVGTTGRPALRPLTLRPVTSDLFETESHRFVHFRRDGTARIDGLTLGDGRTSGLEFRRAEAP